ncbi:hypothetical protein EYF80_003733 [Liparis tanakae]|uniref:Uncharacterized protein n=1 Tax=Liparis tanakae TaxID=230148 RepID=A0A4Z2J6S4_9TELE|nr:hypothetical protein EYF80_003733 [Liparis tanakae]
MRILRSDDSAAPGGRAVLTPGWRELWPCPADVVGGGVGGGGGGGAEPAALRSTASQMQRGSGALQSTPTGFWKLQSDPACDGHGSIARCEEEEEEEEEDSTEA